MMEHNSPSTPDSFDLSPDALRTLGYQMVDLMVEAQSQERHDPVMPDVTGRTLCERLDEPLPRGPSDPKELLEVCREILMVHSRRNGHPRFFGYVCASADPLGALADGLASVLNQNVTSWRSAPAATTMERLVVRWLDEMVGFNGGGCGLLVSGGSAANATAIACAIRNVLGDSPPSKPSSLDRLTVYLSREGHLSMKKAARVFGIDEAHLRVIQTDRHYRMDPEALSRQIGKDRGEGLVPACVCASAGTANTGSVDPLIEIADVCQAQHLWYHIDGAYGAPAAMTADYRWMREAFCRSDSLSLDPHKWLFAPLDVGCVFFRDAGTAEKAFTLHSEYTAIEKDDPIEGHAFFDYGLELSRRFRALKVWMILKARGRDHLAGMIQSNIELRRYLDARIAKERCLQSLGSDLSISCFRYLPSGSEDVEVINDINRRILVKLVHEGRCYMSPTTLDGRFSLRVCIVNFRTTQDDMDLLVDEILRAATELTP